MTAWATAYLTRVRNFPIDRIEWVRLFRGDPAHTQEETDKMVAENQELIDQFNLEQAEKAAKEKQADA